MRHRAVRKSPDAWPRARSWSPGTRDAVEARVYERDALPEGFAFAGPAIIQQADTTTLVEPGWSGLVDAAGNLILTRN